MINRRSSKTQKADSSQFFLNIRYHQNSSWQGSLQRLDTGETISFRSALELLTLIEAAVDQTASGKDGKIRLRQWKVKKEVKAGKNEKQFNMS